MLKVPASAWAPRAMGSFRKELLEGVSVPGFCLGPHIWAQPAWRLAHVSLGLGVAWTRFVQS